MTVVITCTSFPLQAFAPAVAYAATPTAAELSEKNAEKARAELLTAIGADLPGLCEDDTQQSLADATSQNTAWGGVSSQVTDGTVQVATSDDSSITYTSDGQPLYDSASDTIYIYNALQTAVSRQDDAADQPVLTGDGDAETFGTGQPVYAEGSDEPLTYSPEHTYIYVDGWDEGLEDAADEEQVALQSVEEESGEKSEEDFDEGQSEEPAGDEEKGDGEQETDAAAASTQSVDDDTETDDQPTTTAEEDASTIEGAEVLADGENGTTGKVLLADEKAVDELDGRDYVGQVTKEINGETYILIGNEQQLQAIGSNKKVYGVTYYSVFSWHQVYPGDADLDIDQKLGDGAADRDLTGSIYCGVNDEGQMDKDVDPFTGHYYAASENYIIFRDIDASSIDEWQPLMFSGYMLGAKVENEGKIWSADSKSVQATGRPVISGVSVNQHGTLQTDEFAGIGFFGTVSNEINSNNIGVSKRTAEVSNLELRNPSVANTSTVSDLDRPDSLIDILTRLLSILLGGIGGLLDLLLNPLIPGLTLGDALGGILDLRNQDPSVLATGAFAGRVLGDVEINGCIVTNARVDSVMGMSGGFVGRMEGVTEYDRLSNILKLSTDVLENLLNVLPGLGLGELITLLLRNKIIDVSQLIPSDYYNPVIRDCSVSIDARDDGVATIGNSQADMNGGFVGVQIGSIIESSSVNSSVALEVLAHKYAGGFCGLMRDGEMGGLLENLGVELIDVGEPQSLTYLAEVSASSLQVGAETHAGGFAGAAAASYLVDSGVKTIGQLHITTSGGFSGGLVGEGTMGWVTNLGSSENDSDLLSQLAGLVTGLLTNNPENVGPLLTLMGFEPSAALGCSVSAGALSGSEASTISGGAIIESEARCSGGIVGAGQGMIIAAANESNLDSLTFWQSGNQYAGSKASGNTTSVTNLYRVSASEMAGGVAGQMETAAVGGVLNNTLGVGSLSGLGDNGFSTFEVSDVVVTGAKLAEESAEGVTTAPMLSIVAAGCSAGGAIGSAQGGDVNRVHINELGSVSAAGEAGGFIGQASTGSVLGGDGLSLLGLVSISGLLSVADCTRLEVTDSSVSGADGGFTVDATGEGLVGGSEETVARITAGGFFGRASAVKVSSSFVDNLKSVSAPQSGGRAGGFTGSSTTGGLASVADDDDKATGTILEEIFDSENVGSILSVSSLLNAAPYLIPTYENSFVEFINAGGCVEGDLAGGFAGDFQSGYVNKRGVDTPAALKDAVSANPWGVRNIERVTGRTYAGGFGGVIQSGSLADSGGGLSLFGDDLLKVDLQGLLDVASFYVPVINQAGVQSAAEPGGLVVSAMAIGDLSTSGSAGGFAGYACGAQISDCDVDQLRHTKVTEPEDLETSYSNESAAYFGDKSSYAVTAPRYAGGYIGYLNIGSTASLGESLGLLDSISLTDILSALDVAPSIVKNSDVKGASGGFAVLANGVEGEGSPIGHAGGFAGLISGAQITNSNVENFSYIVGQIAAGGYAGEAEPGAVAEVLGDTDTDKDGLLDLLNGIADVNQLATVLQSFVPTIANSMTTCVPCGGAVRAEALSDDGVQRGMAGGYLGHSLGAQIKGEQDEGNEAAAVRIRSVYGAEYAGGFTGLMESAATAEAGSLDLLWGLVDVNNLLDALETVYPTEEHTAVYGPLRNLTVAEWNSWVDAVGVDGGYGKFIQKVENENRLDEMLAQIVYGLNVVAGRSSYEVSSPQNKGGAAGGYVGRMVSGVITDGQAYDVHEVRGMRGAGGFAGVAETGNAATLGSVGLFGGALKLNLDDLLGVANVFVPVIKMSSVEGYRLGMTAESAGTGVQKDDITYGLGNAGGYVGYGSGLQIWGDGTEAADASASGSVLPACNVSNLRKVQGLVYAGGYAGMLTSGAVASASTNVSDGFLQQALNALIGNSGQLLSLLDATVSTVRGADVSAFDKAWGFTVEGIESGKDESASMTYPLAAGGFVGTSEASRLGDIPMVDLNPDATDGSGAGDDQAGGVEANSTLSVTGLRGVDGGLYSGGFVGLADVNGIAEVAESSTEGEPGTSILDLIGLGNISLLSVFRSLIYHASVAGVSDGITVRAHTWDKEGILDSTRFTGNAGGFAGGLLNAKVKYATVDQLNSVSGLNYTGGFVGETGKSALVDVDSVDAIQGLLGVTAGVADVMGSVIWNSSVDGIEEGYTVASTGMGDSGNTGSQMSGGFVGNADLAHIDSCDVTGLKRVGSTEIAGGFAGRTTFAYLVSAGADSPVVDLLLKVVSALLKALKVADLEKEGVIEINLGDEVLKVTVLGDGKTLGITLLGLDVEIILQDWNEDTQTGVVVIKLGDSEIRLNCTNGNIDTNQANSEIQVNLIKGNRTDISNCSVTGIADGYDVFGDGASQTAAGSGSNGYAGGFVGHNDEGKLTNNSMYYADVVSGAENLTGPFTGVSDYSSNWWFNDIQNTQSGNTYRVYRDTELDGKTVAINLPTGEEGEHHELTVSPAVLDSGVPSNSDVTDGGEGAWARFDVTVHNPIAGKSNLVDWNGAKVSDAAIGVYASAGKAVLMDDTAVFDNTGGLTPEPGDGQDPCESSIDLTLQKIWDDGIFGLVRPGEIEFVLYATYTDDGGLHTLYYDQDLCALVDEKSLQVDSEGNPIKPTVTVTKEDAESLWSSTWRKVIENLPVATKDGHYYTYRVEEIEVPGYDTSIDEPDDKEQVIKVTNIFKGMPVLPGTGGTGTAFIMAAGLITLVVGGIWLDRQRRRRAAAQAVWRPTGTHFRD